MTAGETFGGTENAGFAPIGGTMLGFLNDDSGWLIALPDTSCVMVRMKDAVPPEADTTTFFEIIWSASGAED